MLRRILPSCVVLGLLVACATSPIEGDDTKDGDITNTSSTSSGATSSGGSTTDASKDTGTADAAKDTGTSSSSSSSGGQDAGKDTSVNPGVLTCPASDTNLILGLIVSLSIPSVNNCNACNAQLECCFTRPIVNDLFCIPNLQLP
ncbi:MAG: hypothetical protein U0174_27640 [Polyangiaceae bacterium]